MVVILHLKHYFLFNLYLLSKYLYNVNDNMCYFITQRKLIVFNAHQFVHSLHRVIFKDLVTSPTQVGGLERSCVMLVVIFKVQLLERKLLVFRFSKTKSDQTC